MPPRLGQRRTRAAVTTEESGDGEDSAGDRDLIGGLDNVVVARKARSGSRGSGGRVEVGDDAGMSNGGSRRSAGAGGKGGAPPMQWGRQKMRGADPGAWHSIKSRTSGGGEGSGERSDGAKPSGKAAALKAQPAGESVGFTSLLQLADAGVQLEKRNHKRGINGVKRFNAEKEGRGKKAAKTAKEGKGPVNQSSTGSGKGKNKSDRSSDKKASGGGGAKANTKTPQSATAPAAAAGRAQQNGAPRAGTNGAMGGAVPQKKRGRGPNRVQETEEEREAKRLRRVQANRESARLTIRRKHELYDDLTGKANDLEKSNQELRDELTAAYHRMLDLAVKNAGFRDEIRATAAEKGVLIPDMEEGMASTTAATATGLPPGATIGDHQPLPHVKEGPSPKPPDIALQARRVEALLAGVKSPSSVTAATASASVAGVPPAPTAAASVGVMGTETTRAVLAPAPGEVWGSLPGLNGAAFVNGIFGFQGATQIQTRPCSGIGGVTPPPTGMPHPYYLPGFPMGMHPVPVTPGGDTPQMNGHSHRHPLNGAVSVHPGPAPPGSAGMTVDARAAVGAAAFGGLNHPLQMMGQMGIFHPAAMGMVAAQAQAAATGRPVPSPHPQHSGMMIPRPHHHHLQPQGHPTAVAAASALGGGPFIGLPAPGPPPAHAHHPVIHSHLVHGHGAAVPSPAGPRVEPTPTLTNQNGGAPTQNGAEAAAVGQRAGPQPSPTLTHGAGKNATEKAAAPAAAKRGVLANSG